MFFRRFRSLLSCNKTREPGLEAASSEATPTVLPPAQTLLIIRGISGSGKSILAAKLTRWQVAADDYPQVYSSDRAYNLSLQAASHAWCQSQVENWMKAGKWVIAVHNTFTQRRSYQPYLDMAQWYGYAVQVVHCEAVLLANGQVPGNIHNVPAAVLDTQRLKWEAHQADCG